MLKDKTIIVTGSSSGIGLSIAKAAAGAGANVMLHGTKEKLLIEAVNEIGSNASYITCDLGNPDAGKIIIDATVTKFGGVDGLVNNAGIFPRVNIDQVNAENFEKVFNINTRAPLLLCQAAVAQFRAQDGGGSIVNVGSINAYCGQIDLLLYSMSKGALMTMTRNLGDSLGPEKIRVNQINVGWTLTDTEHQTQLNEGQPENWIENIPAAFAPMGTILRPEQIAPHALFWLSDQSYPVTGQVYEVEQYPMIGRSKIAER